MTRRVVITGSAIASPHGYTVDENRQAWRAGKNNFSSVASPPLAASFAVGMCPPPDTNKLPDRKVQKVVIRKDVIGLLTVLNAAKDAGFKTGSVNPERFGIYVGSGSTQVSDLKPYVTLIEKNTRETTFNCREFGRNLLGSVNPMVMLQNLMNNTLCYSSIALDARGVNANFMDFQAAGLRSVIEGYNSIIDDRAEFVIAGGVACTPDPPHLSEGQRLGYIAGIDAGLSEFSRIIKPYDVDGAGTIISEGSAFVVLEEEDHAIARGARILGRIIACHMTSDGQLSFDEKGDAASFARCVSTCMQKAGVENKALGGIFGHGSGAGRLDELELQGYAQLFSGESVPIQSAKACLGEMSEASGVASLMVALDSIERRIMPPTKNFAKSRPAGAGLKISSEAQPLRTQRVLVNTRSFGGLSCSVMISEP